MFIKKERKRGGKRKLEEEEDNNLYILNSHWKTKYKIQKVYIVWFADLLIYSIPNQNQPKVI